MNKLLGFLFSAVLTLVALSYEPVDGVQIAVPWLPIAIGAQLLGSLLTNRSQNQAASAQNARLRQTDALTMQFLQGLNGVGQRPGQYFGSSGGSPNNFEQMGLQLYNGPMVNNQQGNADFLTQFNQGLPGMPEIPNVYRDLGLATDPILQSMRGGPNDAALSSNLLDILGGNTNYDTSLVSSALDPIRQRNLSREVAALQASAPGLGSRFGSAIRRGEVDLRRQSLEDTAAIDAQLAFQAHESAQQRRLAAANELLGLGNLQLGRDTGALNALLGQAGVGINQGQLNLAQGQFGLDRSQLGLDAYTSVGNLGLAQQGQQAQLLQLLMNNQNTRNSQYLQGLGLMSGQQVAASPGYGPAFGDMGQLLLMMQLMNQGRPATT